LLSLAFGILSDVATTPPVSDVVASPPVVPDRPSDEHPATMTSAIDAPTNHQAQSCRFGATAARIGSSYGKGGGRFRPERLRRASGAEW
jgi:hypothetical protein